MLGYDHWFFLSFDPFADWLFEAAILHVLKLYREIGDD